MLLNSLTNDDLINLCLPYLVDDDSITKGKNRSRMEMIPRYV